MRIHNPTAVPVAYDLEGRQIEPFSAVEVPKMTPTLRHLLDSGRVIAVQEPTSPVVSEPRKAGHNVTQERDQ